MNRKKLTKLALLFFLSCIPLISFSQTDSMEIDSSIHIPRSIRNKSWGPIGGFNSAYAELGICGATYGIAGHHPYFGGLSLSGELYLGRDFILAPKISVLMAGGSAFRMSMLYYTDLEKSSLRLRPEIGFGIGVFNFFYGYNIPITNRKMPNVNEHSFALIFFISRKILKEGFF